MGLWSLALLSGAHRPTALPDAAPCPQALGRHHWARYPRPGGPTTPRAAVSPGTASRSRRPRRARS